MQRLERFCQTREVIRHPRDFHLSAGQVQVSGYDKQVIAPRRENFFSNRSFAEQRFVQTDLVHVLQTKRARRVRLRIKINKQDAVAQFRQRGTKVYGRGRFADAAFLVSNRDDFHFSEGSTAVRAVGPTGILPVGFAGGRPACPTDKMSMLRLSDDVAGGGKRKLNFSNFRLEFQL